MKYDELPNWAQKAVLQDISRCFPEMSKSEIMLYVQDKEDFQIVDISEDDEDPDYIVEW